MAPSKTLIFLLSLGGFVLFPRPTAASSSSAEIMRVGDAYGASHFDEIEAIRFTVNIQQGTARIHRSWEWQPKTDQVNMTYNDSTPASYMYSRKELDQGDASMNRKVDAWFDQDERWLLFPLHLIWDTGLQVSFAEGDADLPISPGKAKKMTVAYPSDGGGYSAGDVYDIYYGPLIEWSKSFTKPPKENDWKQSPYVFRQWVVHRGSAKPLKTTWEDYARVGPLIVSLEHHDASRQFHLWLSDVAVKLQNQPDWINAESIK